MLLRQRGQKKTAEQTAGETLSQCIDVEVKSRPPCREEYLGVEVFS